MGPSSFPVFVSLAESCNVSSACLVVASIRLSIVRDNPSWLFNTVFEQKHNLQLAFMLQIRFFIRHFFFSLTRDSFRFSTCSSSLTIFMSMSDFCLLFLISLLMAIRGSGTPGTWT